MLRTRLALLVSASLLVLTGCGPQQSEAAIEEQLLEIDGVQGVIAGVSYDGFARVVGAKLYIPGGTADSVGDAVDEAFEQMWRFPAVDPSRVWVTVTAGEKPDDAHLADRDGIDIESVADELGFEYDGTGDSIHAQADELEARYGSRDQP